VGNGGQGGQAGCFLTRYVETTRLEAGAVSETADHLPNPPLEPLDALAETSNDRWCAV